MDSLTMKFRLLAFFRKKIGVDRFISDDVTADFGEITNYKYSTPTQLQHFKKTLYASKFIIIETSKLSTLNWDKILKVFPELIKDFKKVRK